MMFASKKKKPNISNPINFEHRVHTGFDEDEGKFIGLPKQWQSIIPESKNRPKPLVDCTIITPVPEEKVVCFIVVQCVLFIRINHRVFQWKLVNSIIKLLLTLIMRYLYGHFSRSFQLITEYCTKNCFNNTICIGNLRPMP